MLSQIETTFVILILEDFFLRAPVDIKAVHRCITAIKELDGLMIRLVPNPAPDEPLKDYPFLGRININSAYRVSSQGTLWRKSALFALIREGESIWEFELKGTQRSRSTVVGYYCVWDPILTYQRHVVERGKWFPNEARIFGDMDIGCDFNKRPIMSRKEYYTWYIKWLISHPKKLIPWDTRQKIKRNLKKYFS